MEVVRYKYIFTVIVIMASEINSNSLNRSKSNRNAPTCPYTKIIEDIFKGNNKSPTPISNSEKAKQFLHSIAEVTDSNEEISQEELVNDIIAAINRIKNNISKENNTENKLNEAIILQPKNITDSNEKQKTVVQIKSGMEDKIDTKVHNSTKPTASTLIKVDVNSTTQTTTEKTKYIEVLTIEPNNTKSDVTSHNIIEVLKHLMPMFNSTLTKELHNITVIERNFNKNLSFSATKNVSTIVVTYCDKDNATRKNITYETGKETSQKLSNGNEEDYYYYEENDDLENDGDVEEENATPAENKDILEAAEYGMQKMHELYSVLEPKLYSMGLWLDDTNPARYVAAFNAPSEDSARFTRYGYASLQAAAKLKELISGTEDGLESRAEETPFPKASALRQSPLMQHCPTKGVPKCPPASKRYRTHDGTCNNLRRPRWGSTMTPVQRFLPPSYSDGLQAPRRSLSGNPLPSAREISSLVHESQNVESPGITHLLMQWGQFLDHDVTSTSQSRGFNGSVPRCCKNGGKDFVPKELLHPECFPIAVPSSDPFYGSRGVRCLEFVRSSPAPRDDCAFGWRDQLNQVSAYIDGSPLYGSSARQSDKLRLFRNGMLQYGRVQQRRPILPPERRDELCRGGAVSTDCFRSGDARVNEHPGLVAAHIVWLRHHNRMAQELAHLNPHWSDEKIYQETRKVIGAMIQHITYREFLPIVLGPEVMKTFDLELQKKGYYKGYSPKVHPSPASSFGSAAFRFGHSLVQPSMMRYDRFHRPIHNNVSLHMEVTNPSNIWSMGAVDRLLLGMVNQPIQKRDEFITEELTNHLFQTPSFDFGMDLAAINIQRGRDHGVPSYTAWREPCGLSLITDFEDLYKMMPSRAVWKLKHLYRHVEDIDLFTGGMAERPVVGGLVGPTFACIIAQQFLNLRKGDRFWYENGGFESSFTPAQLQQIRRISLAQVLCRTLDTITSIQPFAFLSPDHEDNDRISCHNGLLNNFDLSPWIEIDSEDNDIRKADGDHTTLKPKRTKPTENPTTTKKTYNASKIHPKRPQLNNTTKTSDLTDHKLKLNNTTKTSDLTDHKLTNQTDLTAKDDSFELSIEALTRFDKHNKTVRIDDKLDFKNKTQRVDAELDIDSRNSRPKTNYGDFDYEDDDTQSIQSVIVNNAHKRPYNNNYNSRPSVLTVTENTNKYTYLINYVPRPTESYRHTTRRAPERDVVKVTYQTYDDTYRRPNKPYYYNRHELNQNYRINKPNTRTTLKDTLQSSARSNDDFEQTTPKATPTEHTSTTTKAIPTHHTTSKSRLTKQTTNKSKPTEQTTPKSRLTELTNLKSKPIDNVHKTIIPTTENIYKLVTFGYVGTYKGDMTDDKLNKKPDNKDKHNETTQNNPTNDEKDDNITKGFSTYVKSELDNQEKSDNIKLSTFYLYESATKPYSLQRSTRRNDDEEIDIRSSNKYYYVNNVLHKRPRPVLTVTDNPMDLQKSIVKENYNYPGIPQADAEDRSSLDSMFELESEPKPAANKVRVKGKKPPRPVKTPTVAFQVMPSEISPSHWAVYEEDADLPEGLPHKTPPIKIDPHALREIPRPITHIGLRRRRPGLF